MLSVFLDETSSHAEASFDWWIGKGIPQSLRAPLLDNPDRIQAVQADGDELEWIRSNISGIPFNKNRAQIWHGDFAKFIAFSLPVKW